MGDDVDADHDVPGDEVAQVVDAPTDDTPAGDTPASDIPADADDDDAEVAP